MFSLGRHNDGLLRKQTCCKRMKGGKKCAKDNRRLGGFFFFFFYLHTVILGSGFPEHGDGGGSQPGCRAAAEGVNVTGWRCREEWVTLRRGRSLYGRVLGREGGGWEGWLATGASDAAAKNFCHGSCADYRIGDDHKAEDYQSFPKKKKWFSLISK